MKTLFVTDLDGTLLTPEKTLTERTVSILNGLLERGMLFTVATARSPATASPILASLRLNLPAVLLNGVFLYDLKEKKYLECETIPQKTAEAVLEVMERANRLPFLYSMGDELCVEYVKLYNREEEEFYSERVGRAYKRFAQVERLEAGSDKRVVYFSMQDKKERLLPILNEVERIPGLRTAFYHDNYSDNYFLEIFKDTASKRSGVEKLKKLCGAERVIAFGDNANDVDMLTFADESYVVENGADAVKKIATGLIGPNTEDAVVEFLRKWHNYL